jgi:hypothetical protein
MTREQLCAASSSSDSSATPPELQVNGDNPAYIQVGGSYTDLGATITGPTADLNVTSREGGINPPAICRNQAPPDRSTPGPTGLSPVEIREPLMKPAHFSTRVLSSQLASKKSQRPLDDVPSRVHVGGDALPRAARVVEIVGRSFVEVDFDIAASMREQIAADAR